MRDIEEHDDVTLVDAATNPRRHDKPALDMIGTCRKRALRALITSAFNNPQ